MDVESLCHSGYLATVHFYQMKDAIYVGDGDIAYVHAQVHIRECRHVARILGIYRDTDGAVIPKCDCVSNNQPEDGQGTKPVPLVAPAWAERDRPIYIDACISHVIARLWENGVVTRGSCCGHNRVVPSIVLDNDITDADAIIVRQLIGLCDDRKWTLFAWRLTEVGLM